MIATNVGNGLAINLNLLQVFVLVAEYRSFKEAAQRSGRSHSAVSNQIKQLEEQLSQRVFYRTTRSVELTREGNELLDIARRTLTDLKEGLGRMQALSERDRSVSVACSISIAGALLPPVVKKFAARHPDVNLSVSEMSLVRMTDRILDGEFDFGIAANYPFHPALEFRPLVDDPLVALIPNSMPQSRWTSIMLKDLCELPLLLVTGESVTQKIFKAATEAQGLAFKKLYDGNMQTTLLLPLVDAGLGATVLASAGDLWAPYPNIRMVPIDHPSLVREISIVTARGRELPPAAHHLFPLIRKEAQRWKTDRTNLSQVA